MKLINDNLKKTGIVNSILIIIALVLRSLNIKSMSTINIVDGIVACIGLICGLVYSLNGYKKNVSKYYKVFMYAFFFCSLLSFATPLIMHGIDLATPDTMFNIVHFVVLVCTCLLAFVKDFGEHNSKTTVTVLFVMNAIVMVNDLLSGRIMISFASLALFVEAIVACVLVSQKYIDKESRNTK